MKKIPVEILKIILLVGLAILGSILATEIALKLNYKPARGLVREMVTCGIVIISFLIFSRFWDKESYNNNIISRGKGKFLFWVKGFIIGGVMIGLTTLILILTGWIKTEYNNPSRALITFPFITMVFTAFWEELVFRGYALNKLQNIIGKHAAAVAIALIFALLHLLSPLSSFAIVISTFLSGLLLNYAFIKTQNLYFPVGIHFAWNALNNLLYENVLFKIDYVNQFTGGIKNPEQGLVAIVITGLAVLYVFTLKSKN